MFQNVADVGDQNEELHEKNSVVYRLKELFKYQNIFIYILTFLLSSLSIKGQIVDPNKYFDKKLSEI